MRALPITTSGAAFGDRCLCRRDQRDFGDRSRDRQARQGGAGHRRPADRAGHRTVARRQRPPRPRAGTGFRPHPARRQMAEHHPGHRRRPDRAGRGAVRGAPDGATAEVDRQIDPRAGRRREAHLDPGDRRQQRDRRHRPRRRGVSPLAGRCRRRARGGDPRAGRAAARRGKLSQAVRGLGRRHLRDDPGRRAAQRQSGAGADDGLRDAGAVDRRHQRHLAHDLCGSGGARRNIRR